MIIFMSMILRSTVQRLFSDTEEGSYTQNVCVFFKTFDTFWYFFTENPLSSIEVQVSRIPEGLTV